MSSCAAAARRQEELSARIERASALLRRGWTWRARSRTSSCCGDGAARQDLAAHAADGRRAVVAAITYYAAGLLGYLAKPLKSLWPAINPDWIVAAAIPLLAFGVWRAVHRLRRELLRD